MEGTDPAELIVKKEPPGSGMLRAVESDVLMNDGAIRRVLHGEEIHAICSRRPGAVECPLHFPFEQVGFVGRVSMGA